MKKRTPLATRVRSQSLWLTVRPLEAPPCQSTNFHVGQLVQLSYESTKKLPERDGEFEYRIKA
jgi:hypothetical protein